MSAHVMLESPEDFVSPVVADRADQPVSEVTERFFRAIVEKLPLERIEEVHLFSPLRQGLTQTGIAVVASRVIEPVVIDESIVSPELELAEADAEATSIDSDHTAEETSPVSPRITVHTARYRQIIKGPERGAWQVDIVEEADAPLLTVETVVRGVQRRAGEDSEIVRYSARQIARILRVELPS